MTFREKSAWAMAALMLVTGVLWLQWSADLPPGAPPLAQLGPLAPYVLWVVVGSIVIQTVLAIWFPRQANAPADERERPLIDKAGNWSGYILAGAVIIGGARFLMFGNGPGGGTELFRWVVGGLIASQFAEYAFQVLLFRGFGARGR